MTGVQTCALPISFLQYSSMEEDQEDIKMEGSILLICKAWGYRGATREIFYKNIKALNYSKLKDVLASLEKKGYVTMEWIDFDKFFAYITPEGEAYLDKWLADLQIQ